MREGRNVFKESNEAPTNNIITNKKILEKELEKVRKNGYAIDNEKDEIGVRSNLYVFLYLSKNYEKIIAATSISGLSFRMKNKFEDLRIKIIKIGKKLSARSGYDNYYR